MSDVTYDILMTGADIKATKVVYEMSKEVNIRIAGDHNPERSAKVVDSVGQGTQVAPKGSGLSIGLAVDKSVELEKCDKINGKVPVGPANEKLGILGPML